MNHNKRLLLAFLTPLLIIGFVTHTSAISYVHNFDGNAYDSDGNPQTGATVIAWINGENRGSAVTQNYGSGLESFYNIDVQGTDSDLGKTVSFTINGIFALESKAFQASGNEDNYHLHMPTTTTTSTTTTTTSTTISGVTTTSSTTTTVPATTSSTTTTSTTTTTTVPATTTTSSTTTSTTTTIPGATTTSSTTSTTTIAQSTTTVSGGPRPPLSYLSVQAYGKCLEDSITFDVRKSGYRPLRGATVTIHRNGVQVASFTTEGDGNGTYKPTAAGTYVFEAKKDNYQTAYDEVAIASCVPVPDTCSDGIQNQNEVGVDCGGVCPSCPSCSDGVQNQGETGIDCGGSCGQCRASCFDGARNQNEVGVDCGGVCPSCPSCSDGVQNQGEAGVDCGGPCGSCAPTCADGVRNQGETGVDCGGPCGECRASCFDDIKNQNEVDIDCGGVCSSCPTCYDGKKNGAESGVDCGGYCGPCPPGSCFDGARNQNEEEVDCGGVCPVCPNCSDGVKNQAELDVDCGGPCKPCPMPSPPAGNVIILYWTGYDSSKKEFCGEVKNLVVFTPSRNMTLNSVLIDGNPKANVTISDISGILAESTDYTNQGNILEKTVTLKQGETYIIYIDKPKDEQHCVRLMKYSKVEKEEGIWEIRDSWCDGTPNGCYLAVSLLEILPTCYDNTRNQNETGVDCGGPCQPCQNPIIGRIIQTAGRSSGFPYLLIGLLLLTIYAVYKKGETVGRSHAEKNLSPYVITRPAEAASQQKPAEPTGASIKQEAYKPATSPPPAELPKQNTSSAPAPKPKGAAGKPKTRKK